MILYRGIGSLCTLRNAAKEGGRHPTEASLSLTRRGCLLVERGRIVDAGPERLVLRDRSRLREIKKEVNLDVGLVLPGLIDCHTHSVFAGRRAHEFEQRVRGATYKEINAAGGGIHSTVKATRKASEEELGRLFAGRVQEFIRQGVVALEVKSGYGLRFSDERKMLSVASREKRIPVVRTFLGAHALPKKQSEAEYVKKICEKDLPALVREKLVDRVDIFVENGFFSYASAEQLFLRAQELGLPRVAHVDQIARSGTLRKLLRFQPQSLEHLVQTNAREIKALAQSETVAVLLPTADFYLKMKYPKAREIIDAGGKVALASDFNPGSSPSQSLNFTGVLARLEMRMTLAEVITAMTLNAAQSLGLKGYGALQPGASASFTCFDCDPHELFYRVGFHPVSSVYSRGTRLNSKRG